MKYKLIPFTEIDEEARNIAVLWIENYRPMGFDIQQKHKLASDIINYANQQLAEYKAKVLAQIDCHQKMPHDRSLREEKIKHKFLLRTSFKNVSGNWQFNGSMTPERALMILRDIENET